MNLEAKPKSDASIGELVGQLSSQLSRLVRGEMRLARQELRQSAKHAGVGAGLFGAAGLPAFFGLASVIAAAIAAVALALPVWAAAHRSHARPTWRHHRSARCQTVTRDGGVPRRRRRR